MSKHSITSVFLSAGVWLAVALHAPLSSASLIVSATSDTGYRGDNVSVILNLASDEQGGDEVDLSGIGSYTFNLLWDSAVLGLQSSTWTGLATGTIETAGTGSLVFTWYDDVNFGTTDLSGGVSITATFGILSDAAYGVSDIVFGDDQGESSLLDDLSEFLFSDVSTGGPMQVTVLQRETTIPEPATLPLLLAGLVAVAGLAHQRNRQAR